MPNVFETGERKVIPAVLVYLRSGDEVFMLHRSDRPDDIHSGKWNGLGGKCEADESPREAAAREVLEEAGLSLPPDRYQVLGVLQFPRFKAQKNEDWVCWVLGAELSTDEKACLWASGPEGQLRWLEWEQVFGLALWPGDRHFLPFVRGLQPFSGTFWYEAGEVRRFELYPLKTSIEKSERATLRQ